MILAVTAYVPIPNHPRLEAEYHMLGEQLHATGIPLLRMDGGLEHCWLWRWLRETYNNSDEFTFSVGDDPGKNSLGYHCVQAQKSEWLMLAAKFAADRGALPDVIVWIDYGIFHVPGVTAQIVRDFIARANEELAIAIPGCWEDSWQIDDRFPCWRFCGGVMVVPTKYICEFDAAMKEEYVTGIIMTSNVTWEVNVLARVERHFPELPIWWYKADHDQTLFTNYRATESADGRKSSFRSYSMGQPWGV